MAGWYSDAESDNEQLNLSLFIRKSFGFQGLSEQQGNTLKKVVQELGATCDDLPKYVFTTDKYFSSLNDTNISLYNVTYIRDCIDANRCLNIDLYRFESNDIEKKDVRDSEPFRDFEPCCSIFHYGIDACVICGSTFKADKEIKKECEITKPNDTELNHVEDDAIQSTKSLPYLPNDNLQNSEVKSLLKKGSKKCWEPWESRLLLDYIISNNLYEECKSTSLYKRIESENFLNNRTADSMRTFFRDSILPNLELFDLPKAVFEKLEPYKKPMAPRHVLNGKRWLASRKTIGFKANRRK